jgi:dipeptidyl aminopeptidase/acylaminoacyl peptidase
MLPSSNLVPGRRTSIRRGWPSSGVLLSLVVMAVFSVCCLTLPAAAMADPAAAASADPSAAADSSATLRIDAWLQLGPQGVSWPAFHAVEHKGYGSTDLLDQPARDPRRMRPERGRQEPDLAGKPLAWRARETMGGPLELTRPAAGAAECWLATYLESTAWWDAELVVSSAQPLRAYLDGEPVATEDRAEGSSSTGQLGLKPGKHLLVLHTVVDTTGSDPWQVDARLRAAGKAATAPAAVDAPATALPVATLDPRRPVRIDDILDAPDIESAVLSPDGELAAVLLTDYDESGVRRRWLEVRDAEDGGLLWSRAPFAGRQVQWCPRERRLSYAMREEDRSGGAGDDGGGAAEDDQQWSLWVFDLDSGGTECVARNIKNLARYAWAHDGGFLIYESTERAAPDERKVKRIINPNDRQPWWRDRSHLTEVSYPDGVSRRLTAGPLSAEGWRISPDDRKLLFILSEPDYSTRPYSTSELWELNLGTLVPERILVERWLEDATYGPAGQLVLQSSPSAFAGLGRDLPEGVVPNDYGGELFLYDRQSGTALPVSRQFAPAIQEIHYSPADGRVYALCLDGQYRRLFAFDPERGHWERLHTGLDAVGSISLAAQAPRALVHGTSAAQPVSLVALDLRKGRSRTILQPAAERYANIVLGRVEPWPCVLASGDTLDGRIYYPPDFSPDRRYPCIVYYYGGTYPTSRDFGGRYPKNVWAGQGYIIYVPQPSGALGYGQAFAARHVNDWGELTAQEVIEGTRAFLAAHQFVDPQRLGCIGASYGGFLTMSLVTKTDMFAAAISHAGISSISSYWGEGFWGYSYGARALANSFPWSDPEIYVDRSPLFHADQIQTPLLLLHGAVDTNVPPGESASLFTALKLLGKQVEFVQIEGQNHWILDHDRRIIWNDTILAWFARWLQDRPGWWDHLYPETDAE